MIPGEYELYLFGHRRPELYGALVEETQAVADLRGGARWPTTRSSSPRRSSSRTGSRSRRAPGGRDDEIGRLNWITPETNRAILEHLDGSHVFDLNVEYFIGMPSWVAAGDPPYGIWMTHTPQGSINDNLSGVGPTCTRSTRTAATRSTSTPTAARTSTRSTTSATTAMFWNGWTADKDLGSRIWNKGGLEKYPPIIARGVLLDVAGMHGVDCLPDGYGDHAAGPPGHGQEAGGRAAQEGASCSFAPAG